MVEPKCKTRFQKCLICESQFKAQWRVSRQAWSKYCSQRCYNGGPRIKTEKKCPGCDTLFFGYAGRVFCTKECCTVNGESVKYTDNEVIYLASINQGYGFINFLKTLYPSKGKNREVRFLDIMSDFKDKTGIDLYDQLQDPLLMVKMPVDKYVALFGFVPPGNGGTGNLASVKSIRLGKVSKTLRFIKTDKHLVFNWGALGS